MDFCIFDWKAFTPIIAALIASITALYISTKWNKQKESEVKAIEAKNIIMKIIDIEKLNNSITNVLHLNDNNTEKLIKKIEDFRSKTNELHRDFDFFKELVKNNERVNKIMNTYLSQSTLCIVRYYALIESEKPATSIYAAAMGLQKKHIMLGVELKVILRDHILYKN